MDLFHVTDWLPTFVSVAGGIIDEGKKLDGVNQWDTLQNMSPSPRTEILLNIDTGIWKNSALRVGDWKVIQEGRCVLLSGIYKYTGFEGQQTECLTGCSLAQICLILY